jgi:peroxiredoxin
MNNYTKLVIGISIIISIIFAQNENVFPITINEKFPEITLKSLEGEDIEINKLASENILLIFPRGKVTENIWCPICHYQYLELVQKDLEVNFSDAYDLDIFFVLPYSSDSLQSWIDDIPTSLLTINNWKYPENEDNIADNVRIWMEYSREFFPFSFKYNKETFDLHFPILFDPDRKVSEGLMLFREEWGGTRVDQNVPTIFLLDKERKVKFKYFSQYTNDRPDANYLVKYLNNMD